MAGGAAEIIAILSNPPKYPILLSPIIKMIL